MARRDTAKKATAKKSPAKKAAAKKTSSSGPTDEATTSTVHHKTSVTKSGDTRTASCSCGWELVGDSKTAGSAAAVHAGQSRRANHRDR